MKLENLHKLLLQNHPSQRPEIEKVVARLPDEVRNVQEVLNRFRKNDPAMRYTDPRYSNKVFKAA